MIADIQNEQANYPIRIEKVGVKGIQYPITVLDRANGRQHTVATINMYVDLPREYRGTHMSRFIAVLHEYRGRIAYRTALRQLLVEMKRRLSAQSGQIEIDFPYFIEKRAPVSGEPGMMGYSCVFHAILDSTDRFEMYLEVRVPVHNLCPCSREISDRGAHNQRGVVTVRIKSEQMIWIEDLVEIVESSVSAPLFPHLKREDEKFVTEYAYDNPRFVEDVTREVAEKLSRLDALDNFSVEAENYESIHNHNAYACLSSDALKKSE